LKRLRPNVFADDTSLYLVVDDPIETTETLNGDLDKIHIWSEKWLVKFNPQKTETMILSKKNSVNILNNIINANYE
jgi:hypothetical protein